MFYIVVYFRIAVLYNIYINKTFLRGKICKQKSTVDKLSSLKVKCLAQHAR